jgi:hypothetical protein
MLGTMMPTDSTARPIASTTTLTTAALFVPGRLELLRELEASLLRSRKALLALDLTGIEQGTREQIGLVRAMASSGQLEIKMRTEKNDSLADSQEIATELKRCVARVLQASRVQAALLDRMQRKLRILGNMLAGPSSIYGCLLAKHNAPAPVVYTIQDGAF